MAIAERTPGTIEVQEELFNLLMDLWEAVSENGEKWIWGPSIEEANTNLFFYGMRVRNSNPPLED